MNDVKELMHKFLDGEASAEELAVLSSLMEADSGLKEEFNELQGAVRIMEHAERLSPPLSFASEVMRRLPEPKAPFAERLREFFLGGRTLRWNMATAAAALALVVIVMGGILEYRNGNFQSRKKNDSVILANSPGGASAVAVRFAFSAPKAKAVAIAGDFNKWKTDENILKRQDGGIWTIEIPLNPGSHQYMFIVDGEAWVPDPNAREYRDDGFGYRNAVVKVDPI